MAKSQAFNKFSKLLNAQADAIDGEGLSQGLRAILTASRDATVQQALFEHLGRGERFVSATPHAAAPHKKGGGYIVLFSFSSSGRDVDLLPPSLAAFMDPDGTKVVRVADPAPATLTLEPDLLARTVSLPSTPPTTPTTPPPPRTWCCPEGRPVLND